MDVVLAGVDQGALATAAVMIGWIVFCCTLANIAYHLPAALDQAQDGWLVLLQRAAARRSCQSATPPCAPLFATAAGWPLCPATTSTSSISTSPSSIAAGALANQAAAQLLRHDLHVRAR